MHDLPNLTATESLALLKAGALSAEALATACLERVRARDADVRAWVTVDADQVLAQARACDARVQAGATLGALHGLPVGIKDVIQTQGLPTRHNSALRAAAQPDGDDAACVALLRAAGAVIFGKTDTVEFAATGRRAATRNPHDLARTPGASSSGSAAAVADLHVPLALATQTGGSTIRPASYCGVWALKPTWGLASTEGCKQFSPTLDTLGWMARSADDLRLMLDVFDAEPAPSPGPAFSLDCARIAVYRTPMWHHAEPATRQAMDDAQALLRAAGAQLEPLQLPAAFDTLAALQLRIMFAEGGVSFLSEYRMHGEALHASLRDQVLNARGTSRAELCAAWDEAAAGRPVFDAAARGFDAVLTPSTTGAAPLGLMNTGDLVFNGLWTLLHVPCVNVPGLVGLNDESGLPVGLTLTGPRFTDRRVIDVARALGRLFVQRRASQPGDGAAAPPP